jgi:phosphoribosylformylglycinamidine synthase
VTEPLHRTLGLTDDELDDICQIIGRQPNHLELAMYSVMWSEHCSYKSSRIHLRRFPTEGERVMVGPGENAGVVDVGDGIAVAMRIESHNHPSAIEPYQGAATGVGGILRDIFTMGARPIALMDPLRFGPLEDARSRWIAEGVVSGVSGYGNSVGVPTVGGETVFDETYQDNPLVNVFCLGILPHDRLVLGQASGVGNLAVLMGSSTGRDGIGGVSVLASAGFTDDAADSAKRPSVQVGDPFEEKRLIEACLALLDARLVVGIQDLGGAGLTCATSETASRGGVGMDVFVGAIPRREPGMEPLEVMTSESQERMLAIVEPANLAEVLSICSRWEVRADVIGEVTNGGGLRILDCADRTGTAEAEVLADVPAASLHEDAPLYERPLAPPADLAGRQADEPVADADGDVAADLLAMLCDTSWISSQYDHQLFLNTVEGPGGDATVLRLKDPITGADTGRGLALTADGNHRWCAVDPRAGATATVVESIMNLACVGAVPIALVDCMNYGNPEHPEVMWQLSEGVDGLSAGCEAFGVPVIGGNVSLYNESRGSDIDPTPVIAVLGLVEQLTARPPGVGLIEGGRILLVGTRSAGLAGSAWAWNRGLRGGRLPAVDTGAASATAAVVRQAVTDGLVARAHDVSDGGVGGALAEMAVRSGIGFNVARIHDRAELFGEGVGGVLLCATAEDGPEIVQRCEAAGVPVARLGVAGGDRLVVKGLLDLSLTEAHDRWRNRLADSLGSGTTQG